MRMIQKIPSSENRLFPPHNVIGTGGRELYGSLKSLYQDYEQEENVYWIDKTALFRF